MQLAKIAGMKVIGTVSTAEKAAFARKMGADEIIFYRDEDVIARTRALTDGRGVSLVLDHVCGPEFCSYLARSTNGAPLSPTMRLPDCRRKT